MLAGFINLIIYLMVLGILYAILVYVVDNFIPDPPAKIIKVVGIVVIALIAVILLLGLVGVQTGVDLPRLNA